MDRNGYLVIGKTYWYGWYTACLGRKTRAAASKWRVLGGRQGEKTKGKREGGGRGETRKAPLVPLSEICLSIALLEEDYKVHVNDMASHLSPVKRICVFEHSVMTNFNCACPAIQKGQGSDFLSEGSSWLIACMSEQRRFWRDCANAQARLNLRCSHRR